MQRVVWYQSLAQREDEVAKLSLDRDLEVDIFVHSHSMIRAESSTRDYPK